METQIKELLTESIKRIDIQEYHHTTDGYFNFDFCINMVDKVYELTFSCQFDFLVDTSGNNIDEPYFEKFVAITQIYFYDFVVKNLDITEYDIEQIFVKEWS
jgi:hypothetical protein